MILPFKELAFNYSFRFVEPFARGEKAFGPYYVKVGARTYRCLEDGYASGPTQMLADPSTCVEVGAG